MTLGMTNDAESTTALVKIGDDTDSLTLYVQNEGSCLKAVAPLGIAVEGQTGVQEGLVGVKGTAAGPATGVLGVSASGAGVSGLADLPGGAGIRAEGRGGADGVLAVTSGVDPETQFGGAAIHAVSTDNEGFAGLFEGSVVVELGRVQAPDANFQNLIVGTIESQSKMFVIAHPLDPEHRELCHTSVECPEMKNFYDGCVTLDDRGEAVVELPEWFEALNTDLRYQLTPIGAACPNLHIAGELRCGRFVIGGGRPAVRVSWQITGVRQDTWARDHRNPVERPKQATGGSRGLPRVTRTRATQPAGG